MKLSMYTLMALCVAGCVSMPQNNAAASPTVIVLPQVVQPVGIQSEHLSAPYSNAVAPSTALVQPLAPSPVLLAQSAPVVTPNPVQQVAETTDPQPQPAAVASDALSVPSWIITAATMLVSLFPSVGGWLLIALKFLGMLSAVLTAISAAITGVSAATKGVLNFAGLQWLSSKIQAIEDVIQPVIQYLSVFNVQKK